MIGAFAYTVARGEQVRVRYSDSTCLYYLIYENSGPIDLVGIGGSRMMTSFDADDVEAKLTALGKANRVVYNLSQSRFSLEKSYVVFRDLLEHRKVKTALVMLEPRRFAARQGRLHERFLSISKLSDIPLAVSAVSSESTLQGVRGFSDLVKKRIKLPGRVSSCSGHHSATCDRLVHRVEKTRNCHLGDYRFNLDILNSVSEENRTKTDQPLSWNFDDEQESFNDTYIRAFKKLASKHDVSLFFVFLNRSTRTSPEAHIAEAFEAKYDLPLLVLPAELEEEMATMGRRDNAHIFSKGREKYLPWLFESIQSRCRTQEGCL